MAAKLPLPPRAVRSAGVAVSALAAALCIAGVAEARSPVTMEGGDEAARNAIAALLPEREQPQTLFDAERLAEEAAEIAAAWLRSEGYYEGQARPLATEEPPRAVLALTLGRRFTLAQPRLDFLGDPPGQEAQAAANAAIAALRPGAPARAASVLAAEAAALAALRDAGHMDAAAGERRVVVDHATGQMTAQFSVTAGPALRLGALTADPPELIRPGALEQWRTWRSGDRYTPEALRQLRRNASSTGAFARVGARLEPDPAAADRRNVVLELEAAPPNAFEYGLGYSTTEGVGVDIEWTRRNATRRADTLTLAANLAEQRQALSAALTRPHARGPGRPLRIYAEAAHEETDAFERSGIEVTAAIEAERRRASNDTYGASLNYDQFSRATGVESALVVSAFAERRRDSTGNILDARDGRVLTLRLEPAVSVGEAAVGFLRATAEARHFASVGEDGATTLAARLRLGWIGSVFGATVDIPPDRFFYAGGGGSVRGYNYNSIYPEQSAATSDPPGGAGLMETSLEVRQRLTRVLGVVAFLDGGAAFNDAEDASNLRWGAGLGLRYDLGFAPLRVDVAAPINAAGHDPDYAVYVSIGQAF